MIPFNKPYFTGKELEYIKECYKEGKLSGVGNNTRICQDFIESKYNFKKCFLTPSCTQALEMAAILCDIKNGDEVIIPDYTYVSSATPFALRGAKIVFCDSENERPHISPENLKHLINEKTKAVLIMHYGGVACDIKAIKAILKNKNIYLIEDAAHCINSKFEEGYLGSFGDFAAFSFHETKNVQCGQGGLLVINNEEFINRAEEIWFKGTNRLKFERSEKDFYEWTDLGSTFYPTEITAAILRSQLENIDLISKKRLIQWHLYNDSLSELKTEIGLPLISEFSMNHNAHIFYLTMENKRMRDKLLDFLKKNEVLAIFHYLSLSQSKYAKKHYPGEVTSINSNRFSETLIRLPLYHELSNSDQEKVIDLIFNFFKND